MKRQRGKWEGTIFTPAGGRTGSKLSGGELTPAQARARSLTRAADYTTPEHKAWEAAQVRLEAKQKAISKAVTPAGAVRPGWAKPFMQDQNLTAAADAARAALAKVGAA